MAKIVKFSEIEINTKFYIDGYEYIKIKEFKKEDGRLCDTIREIRGLGSTIDFLVLGPDYKITVN